MRAYLSRTSAPTPVLIRAANGFQIILGKVRPNTSPGREPSTSSDHCSLAGVDLLKNLIQRTGSLQPISQLPLPLTPLSPLALTHGHRHSSVSSQIGSHCLHKRSVEA